MEEQATPNSQGSKITNGNKPDGNQTTGQTNLASTSNDSPARAGMGWATPFGLRRVFMDELDRLVESFGLVGRPPAEQFRAIRPSQHWIPAVEVFERDGKFIIRADVPGLDADELDVAIDDDKVALSGERVDEQEDRGSAYYRRERSYGRFYRVVPLPEGVDTSQAEATFNNGVLEISIPAPRRPEARKLEVKDGASNESPSKADAKPSASSSSATSNPAPAH
jgi:HSP20 family protein